MIEEEIYCEPEKRNKAKVKRKENKKYPYKHCRNCGKILINEQKEQK